MKVPMHLNIDGHLTADRNEWGTGMLAWGTRKYGDDNNDEKAQKERAVSLANQAAADRLDGIRPKAPQYSDYIHVVATTEDGKAARHDGGQGEMLKARPPIAAVKLFLGQKEYLQAIENLDGVPAFKTVPIASIPKEKV